MMVHMHIKRRQRSHSSNLKTRQPMEMNALFVVFGQQTLSQVVQRCNTAHILRRPRSHESRTCEIPRQPESIDTYQTYRCGPLSRIIVKTQRLYIESASPARDVTFSVHIISIDGLLASSHGAPRCNARSIVMIMTTQSHVITPWMDQCSQTCQLLMNTSIGSPDYPDERPRANETQTLGTSTIIGNAIVMSLARMENWRSTDAMTVY